MILFGQSMMLPDFDFEQYSWYSFFILSRFHFSKIGFEPHNDLNSTLHCCFFVIASLYCSVLYDQPDLPGCKIEIWDVILIAKFLRHKSHRHCTRTIWCQNESQELGAVPQPIIENIRKTLSPYPVLLLVALVECVLGMASEAVHLGANGVRVAGEAWVLFPYLIFVIFSPRTLFLAKFFSTQNRVNCKIRFCDKTA